MLILLRGALPEPTIEVDVSRRPQAAVFFGGRSCVDACPGAVPKEVIVLGSITPLAASSSGGGATATLLFVVLMGAVFYLLLIRPQQRRQRQQRALIQSVEVGDEVMTTAGIYGTVRELDDESVTIEVTPGVDIRFTKGAIARKLVYDDGYEEDEGPDEGAEKPEQREAGEQK
jgi:preprotein translocase subunit YajC